MHARAAMPNAVRRRLFEDGFCVASGSGLLFTRMHLDELLESHIARDTKGLPIHSEEALVRSALRSQEEQAAAAQMKALGKRSRREKSGRLEDELEESVNNLQIRRRDGEQSLAKAAQIMAQLLKGKRFLESERWEMAKACNFLRDDKFEAPEQAQKNLLSIRGDGMKVMMAHAETKLKERRRSPAEGESIIVTGLPELERHSAKRSTSSAKMRGGRWAKRCRIDGMLPAMQALMAGAHKDREAFGAGKRRREAKVNPLAPQRLKLHKAHGAFFQNLLLNSSSAEDVKEECKKRLALLNSLPPTLSARADAFRSSSGSSDPLHSDKSAHWPTLSYFIETRNPEHAFIQELAPLKLKLRRGKV